MLFLYISMLCGEYFFCVNDIDIELLFIKFLIDVVIFVILILMFLFLCDNLVVF